MQTPLLYWNTDTGIVSTQPFSRTPVQGSSVRGDQPLSLVLVQGTPPTAVLLGTGENVGVVVRNPANLKAGCLAGPTLLTRGANAAAGYTGTTSTDTTLTRTLMHVDANDSSAELTTFPAEAVFYHVPAAGGDAIESRPFSWTVEPNYYRPLQPPADLAVYYPPANQVDTITARNAAIAAATFPASAITSGVFPPNRVGSGTPSSTTFLRGDGSWAGQTPGGNTVAATGKLLMGDNAGNATAVANSADLLRALRARSDQRDASAAAPVNQLTLSQLQIRNGTINADGTITIPANDYVIWADPNGTWTGAAVAHYCYAVATTDVPVGASGSSAGFYLEAWFRTNFAISGANSSPLPGVSKLVFTNSTSNGDYNLHLVNPTSSAVTIFPPSMTATDVGLLAVQSFVDTVDVPSQPVANLDFTRFASDDRTGRYLNERLTSIGVDSVAGDDSGGGSLYQPARTLNSLPVNDGFVYGLYRGSVFRDSMPFSGASNSRGLAVQDVAFGSLKPLPIISALDPVVAANWTSNGDGSYSYDWTAESAAVDNNGYKAVYVVEINTATESANPIAPRRRLLNVNFGDVAGTPGAAYISNVGGTTWRARIHPTGGHPPTDNTYRYEVVVRFGPIAYPQAATGDVSISGLHLVGGSNGYGSLSGPPGFVGDRLVVGHATAHSAVLGGGSLQRSIFYDCGTNTGIALTWYFGDPTGVSWDLRHCLFYANVGDQAANCLLSHSGGNNYARGDISDTAFIGARWSNGSLQGTAIGYDNVATGALTGIYVQSIREIFGYTMPLSTEVKNSIFRSVHKARIGFNFHDNIVLAESGSDPTDNNYHYPTVVLFQQNGASITNNILWGRGTDTGVSGDGGVYGLQCYTGVTSATFQRNILILNPSDTTQAVYGSFAGATGLSTDYNLVINLAKVGGGFLVFSPGGNVFTWADYLTANPTLDQHSLYLDLSTDPRGLKAVFVDPINGDFRWAQTEVARRCAAYCAANHVGPATVPSRWPVVPTVDEAVKLLTRV